MANGERNSRGHQEMVFLSFASASLCNLICVCFFMAAAVSCPFIHRQDVATRQVTAHLCPASICWRKVPLSRPQIQISRLVSLDQTPTFGPINRGLQGLLYNLLDSRRNENRGPLIQKAGKMPFRVHTEVLPLFCSCHSTLFPIYCHSK